MRCDYCVVFYCGQKIKKRAQKSFSYQQVTVTTKANTRAAHPLQVNVRVLSLYVPETALQRTLLGKQGLEPETETHVVWLQQPSFINCT